MFRLGRFISFFIFQSFCLYIVFQADAKSTPSYSSDLHLSVIKNGLDRGPLKCWKTCLKMLQKVDNCLCPIKKVNNEAIAIYFNLDPIYVLNSKKTDKFQFQFQFRSDKLLSRQSKAADRSHISIPVTSFASVFFAHCCCTSDKADIVDVLINVANLRFWKICPKMSHRSENCIIIPRKCRSED